MIRYMPHMYPPCYRKGSQLPRYSTSAIEASMWDAAPGGGRTIRLSAALFLLSAPFIHAQPYLDAEVRLDGWGTSGIKIESRGSVAPRIASNSVFTRVNPQRHPLIKGYPASSYGHAISGMGWVRSTLAQSILDDGSNGGDVLQDGAYSRADFGDHFYVNLPGKEGRTGTLSVYVGSSVAELGPWPAVRTLAAQLSTMDQERNSFLPFNQIVEVPFRVGSRNVIMIGCHTGSATALLGGLDRTNPGDATFYRHPMWVVATVAWGGILSVKLNATDGVSPQEPQSLSTVSVSSVSGLDYKLAVTPPDHVPPDLSFSPRIMIQPEPSASMKVDFIGVLESSPDLINWSPVQPQPASPYRFTPAPGGKLFYRSAPLD